MTEETKEFILGDDEEENETTIEELKEEIETLKKAMILVASGKPPEEPAGEKESTIQKILREMEAGYSAEQLTQAENWVRKQIGGRLQIVVGPGAEGRRKDEIVFDKHVVTQEDIDTGAYKLPVGFTITRGVPVHVLARFYIAIILSEDYEDDAEKLLAMIEEARRKGAETKQGYSQHPEFEYLFDANENLKPLRRRQKHRRKSIK